jgi:hypothetical protein
MKKILVVLVSLVAVALLAGCYPKGPIYGVGNEGGLIFTVNRRTPRCCSTVSSRRVGFH